MKNVTVSKKQSVPLIIVLCVAAIVFSAMGLLAKNELDARQAIDPSRLYQVGLIDALKVGYYDGFVSMDTLLAHGDFGIGTFDQLDGEMLVIDGIIYKIDIEGTVTIVPDEETTPFATIAFFSSEQSRTLSEVQDFDALLVALEDMIENQNHIYAFRIDGTFQSMVVRSVPPQNLPYPTLANIIANEQQIFELDSAEGSMVGFWFPAYLQGINESGFHFHFIDSKRESGGHVLSLQVTKANAFVSTITSFHVVLPTSDMFAGFVPNKNPQPLFSLVE